MVFTERQKSELKTLTSDLVRDIVKSTISDKEFLNTLIDKISDKVSQKISDTLKQLSTKINNLETRVVLLEKENERYKTRMDDIEQQNKRNQLRVYGMPGNIRDQGRLNSQVVNMFEEKLGIKDIKPVFCQQIGSPLNKKNGAILVHFNSCADRNEIFHQKKKLKGSNMVIVEELTRTRYELMLLAKEKFGKKAVWTNGGRIFASIDNKKVSIKTEDDVMNRDE